MKKNTVCHGKVFDFRNILRFKQKQAEITVQNRNKKAESGRADIICPKHKIL